VAIGIGVSVADGTTDHPPIAAGLEPCTDAPGYVP
jgi:hypothetical protein